MKTRKRVIYKFVMIDSVTVFVRKIAPNEWTMHSRCGQVWSIRKTPAGMWDAKHTDQFEQKWLTSKTLGSLVARVWTEIPGKRDWPFVK